MWKSGKNEEGQRTGTAACDCDFPPWQRTAAAAYGEPCLCRSDVGQVKAGDTSNLTLPAFVHIIWYVDQVTRKHFCLKPILCRAFFWVQGYAKVCFVYNLYLILQAFRAADPRSMALLHVLVM